jgi:uncharacterized membrane protein YjfL (UPF0719 family)
MIADEILTSWSLLLLATGFVVIFAVLFTVRFLYGAAAGVNTTEELAHKDNFAFGVSLAGATLGVAIMLTGVATGGFAPTYVEEVTVLVVYSVVGLAMMWLTRLISDRIVLPGFSVRQEIHEGNIAVAIVDGGNIIATAIMVRAVIVWSGGSLVEALQAVVVGYVVSQIVLAATGFYRVSLYARRNQGQKLQDAVRGGNVALALRFVGFQAGVALAVSAASQLVVYDPAGQPVIQALIWGAFSVGMAVIVILLSLLAEKCVLTRIDVAAEVDEQRNLGVGLTEVAVYIGIGLLLNAFLS